MCRDLKFANGLFIALATMLITLAIGWLAAFSLGRMNSSEAMPNAPATHAGHCSKASAWSNG